MDTINGLIKVVLLTKSMKGSTGNHRSRAESYPPALLDRSRESCRPVIGHIPQANLLVALASL